MESFSGKLRDECLKASRFWNRFDARRKISDWKAEYNFLRPHSGLGYLNPDEFARRFTQSGGGKTCGLRLLGKHRSRFPLSLRPGDDYEFPIIDWAKNEVRSRPRQFKAFFRCRNSSIRSEWRLAHASASTRASHRERLSSFLRTMKVLP